MSNGGKSVDGIEYFRYFTPNADGANDVWEVRGLTRFERSALAIYDRFGKLLYSTTGRTFSWDGTINGQPLPESDYWFRISYTEVEAGEEITKYINDHFSLKR